MPDRPRLLDLFCGAGGAALGYHRAGFDVVGVDHRPQPRYPFEFIQADALEALADVNPGKWDAIHASPPCQAYSSLRRLHEATYPDLIAPIRGLLEVTGLAWAIENVVGAPLINPVQLCGSSFGLNIKRHRLFESNVPMLAPSCAHGLWNGHYRVGLGSPQNSVRRRRRLGVEPIYSRIAFVYGSTRYPGDLADRKAAMGIDWMTNRELTQAIPPAYTEWIGHQLLAHLGSPTIATAVGSNEEVQ